MALLPTLRLGTVLAAAPLVLAAAAAMAWLGGDLGPPPGRCPYGGPGRGREGVIAPPPAAPAPPKKSRDATYDPWELVSV